MKYYTLIDIIGFYVFILNYLKTYIHRPFPIDDDHDYNCDNNVLISSHLARLVPKSVGDIIEPRVMLTRGSEIFVCNGFMYVDYDDVNFDNTIRF